MIEWHVAQSPVKKSPPDLSDTHSQKLEQIQTQNPYTLYQKWNSERIYSQKSMWGW